MHYWRRGYFWFSLKAVAWRSSIKKVFLEILQNSQENTCARAVCAEACNFIKKEILEQVLSCQFCKISKNIFFTELFRTTASVVYLWWRNRTMIKTMIGRCYDNIMLCFDPLIYRLLSVQTYSWSTLNVWIITLRKVLEKEKLCFSLYYSHITQNNSKSPRWNSIKIIYVRLEEVP